MRYQYRIVSQQNKHDYGYEVQCKPFGIIGWVFPWVIVSIETSVYKARLFCWNIGHTDIIPEVEMQ